MAAGGEARLWVELPEFGRFDWGAPSPLLLLGEHRAALSYYLQDTSPWDGKTVHSRNASVDVMDLALVEFEGVFETRSFCTAQPNHNHPAYEGLWSCAASIRSSEWAKQIGYGAPKHLVFTFHDTVIELLCESWQVSFVQSSSFGLVPRMRAFVLG